MSPNGAGTIRITRNLESLFAAMKANMICQTGIVSPGLLLAVTEIEPEIRIVIEKESGSARTA
ncbi:hypothetical protein MASR1M12_42020 [Erysipelotrichia bacterium]